MNDMIICCVNTHVDGNDHDDVPHCVIQFINVDLFCLMATYFETKLTFLQRLENTFRINKTEYQAMAHYLIETYVTT